MLRFVVAGGEGGKLRPEHYPCGQLVLYTKPPREGGGGVGDPQAQPMIARNRDWLYLGTLGRGLPFLNPVLPGKYFILKLLS